jgi:predicted O-methyltransferase YrrM
MFIENFRLKTAIQKLLCSVVELIDFSLLHPRREMMRKAVRETVEYISARAPMAVGVDTAKDLLRRALKTAESIPGSYVEFGVYKGATLNFIADLCPQRKIWGFDSFEGLPEAWSGNTSMFNAAGKAPHVRSNVTLVRGWFDQSLPGWLAGHADPIAFAHIDCDVYSSTKAIFDAIGPRLKPDAVIVFDEYFGYPGWQHHEFKAFQEFVQASGVEYRYLYYARIQCAVQITRNPLAMPPA